MGKRTANRQRRRVPSNIAVESTACAFFLVLVLVICDRPVAAQTTSSTPDSPPIAKALMQVARDFSVFPSRETLTVLGIGAVGAISVLRAEQHLDSQFDNRDYRFLAPGEIIGKASVQAGVATAAYGVGRLFNNGGTVHRIGGELVRAQILTQSMTLGIKLAARRERPNGETLSFPSGHASGTFATVTVLARHFDWRVSVPSYLAATYVAFSRVHEHKHYMSDVLFGAALGIAAGRSITSPESALTWTPVVTPTIVAFMITYAD